jgi:fermentation-respiration switch protein FrsA (DUF1100 family)
MNKGLTPDPGTEAGSPESAAAAPYARLLGYSLPGLAVAGGIGVLGWLRERYQHRRMFLPERYPAGVWDPKPHGFAAEDRWFEAADGCRLHGWWIPHPRPRGAVLYCHGNSGSIGQQVEVLREMLGLRSDVFVFDYRGYGRSEGVPSEAGLYRDARAAFDHLTGPLGRRPDQVILFGHSLGGAVAVDGALVRPAAGLVVQASFTDIRSAARAAYPDSLIARFARNGFRSIDKVGRLELPKLFVHGTDDPTVPVEMSRALFDRATAPQQHYEVPGGHHNDLYLVGGTPYFRRLAAFRDECLEAAADRRAAAVAVPTAAETVPSSEQTGAPPTGRDRSAGLSEPGEPPSPAGPARDPWSAARDLLASTGAAARNAWRRVAPSTGPEATPPPPAQPG